MIPIENIDKETLMARGVYATIRGAHEDEKKSLQVLCGSLSSTATRVLKRMQPDNDEVPESVEELLSAGRSTMDAIESTCKRIADLARQRAQVYPEAWGR